jgi:hypothetical protein
MELSLTTIENLVPNWLVTKVDDFNFDSLLDESDLEKEVIKEDLRLKLALRMSSEALLLAKEIIDGDDGGLLDKVLQIKKVENNNGCSLKDFIQRFKNQGQERITRHVLYKYLRSKKVPIRKCQKVIAELVLWAYAVWRI